jgi:hypothetical protein
MRLSSRRSLCARAPRTPHHAVQPYLPPVTDCNAARLLPTAHTAQAYWRLQQVGSLADCSGHGHTGGAYGSLPGSSEVFSPPGEALVVLPGNVEECAHFLFFVLWHSDALWACLTAAAALQRRVW